ncbi:hypothetical protein KOI35_27710 [Actinoplanes bogorensis]|uniref:SMODS and SLOG-associating 2TM effector domain-containing protein n=1 Tax=Paractinoplanes bogorensis TaxID=1610840 RepID=A0ABS5YV26_9ACTN|nr:hypothetical protein [Actinoplanes bogorensis]MBU2667303.1 hypothetical protein [Actinoplanes bogorensis]
MLMPRLDVVAGAPADLMTTIRELREQADAGLRAACLRRRRLTNITVVASALATVLTAGPAFGGKSLTAWLTGALELSSPAWQLLCATAAVCSLATAIAGQLLKADSLDDRIAAAQTARVRLEALEIRAGLHQIERAEAVAELVKCVEDAAVLWQTTWRLSPAKSGGEPMIPPTETA